MRVKSATLYYLLYNLPGQLNLNFGYIASRKAAHEEYALRTLDLAKDSSEYRQVVPVVAASTAFWFGVIAFLAVMLHRNRRNLQQPQFRRQFLYLYGSFKGACFYWDSVLLTLKVSLIVANNYFNQDENLRTMVSLVLLKLYFFSEIVLDPYSNQRIRSLSLLSYTIQVVNLLFAHAHAKALQRYSSNSQGEGGE